MGEVVILKLIFIIVPLLFSLSADAQKSAKKKPAPKQPAFKAMCKSMTPAAWKTNYDGCMTAFAPGIQAKQISHAKSSGICNCVANGLVKESTCKDIERFQKDKTFEQEMTTRLAKKCIPKEKPAARRKR